MDDHSIVDLYWKRDEEAIEQTARKYGAYCHSIAFRILENHGDADECVNDTYRGAWESIPPHRPAILSTYLGKLARRISLKVLRSRETQKRGRGIVALSLDELSECIPAGTAMDAEIEFQELVATINRFVSGLPVEERRVFVRRYYHALSITEICEQYHFSKSKVESMLHRTRKKLKKNLDEEGFFV